MDLDYKAVGKRVREKRLAKKLTQSKLADEADVSPTHISNIERARTKVSLPVLVKIANALDATLDELACESLRRADSVYVKEIAEMIELCSMERRSLMIEVLKVMAGKQ